MAGALVVNVITFCYAALQLFNHSHALPNLNYVLLFFPQDPAGIFELVELVGNGTYGQVYKVGYL